MANCLITPDDRQAHGHHLGLHGGENDPDQLLSGLTATVKAHPAAILRSVGCQTSRR